MSRLSKFVRTSLGLTKVPEHEKLLRRKLDALPRNGAFVDLGANVGSVTKIALEFGHQVFAVEPDPASREPLEKQFLQNPNVTIIPKAVGSSARIARLFTHPAGYTEASSLLPQTVLEGGGFLEVEVLDIVQFLRPLLPIALLKMDIEGAEAECLEAILDNGLHRNIGLILVETHERFSEDLSKRIDAIRQRIVDENITNIDLTWI